VWSEAFNDFKGFSGFDREVKKIIQTATDVGDERCVEMIDEEVEERIEERRNVLKNEELEDLVKSSAEK
jgi:hypothetical protein